MPSVASIIKDLDTLRVIEQEEILNHLEEIVILGSCAVDVTDEVKENRFSKGKSCHCCRLEEVSRSGTQYLPHRASIQSFAVFVASPIFPNPLASPIIV